MTPQENRRKDDPRLSALEKRVDSQDVVLKQISKSQTSTHRRLNELVKDVRISFEDIRDSQTESNKCIADKLESTSKDLADKLELTSKDLADKLEKADRQRAEDLLNYQTIMMGKTTKIAAFQSGLYFLVTTAWTAIVAIGGWIFLHHDKIKAVKP